MTGRWGNAGVRLTPAEIAQRRARAIQAKAQRDAREAERLGIARTKWRMGLVVPHTITLALDSHSLYGPEVDIACGGREPDVDLWEAGKLYPSWEQLVLLAELTGKAPLWFMAPNLGLSMMETSMRFHLPPGVELPAPVHTFTVGALSDAVRRWGIDPSAVP